MPIESLCRVCVKESHEYVCLSNLYYEDMKMEQDTTTPVICNTCNHILKDFHQFYQMVKQAQKKYVAVKIEDDCDIPLSEYLENNIDDSLDSKHCSSSRLEITKSFENFNVDSLTGPEIDLPCGEYGKKKVNIKKSTNTKRNCLKRQNKKIKKHKSVKSEIFETSSECVPNLYQMQDETNDTNIKCEEFETMDNDDGFQTNVIENDKINCEFEEIKRKVIKKYNLNEIIKDDKFILNQQKLDELIALYLNMTCEFCSKDSKTFSSYEDLNKHSMDVRPSYVKCCNYTTDGSKVMMERHILQQHIAPNNTSSFKIPAPNNTSSFKIPAPNNTSSFKIPCRVCKKLITASGMKKHLLNHLPPEKRAFKCDQCSAGFFIASLLKIHVERCHTIPEQIKCKICNKMIRNKIYLAHHIKRVHESTKEHLCSECGKSYKNFDNFTAHMKKHKGEEDKVKCPTCNVIVKRSSLRRHLLRHQPESKQQCPQCPYKALLPHLNRHISRVHHKQKNHACTFCHMEFYREANLQDHIASRHTGIPRYTCEFCDKTFMSSGNYHLHRKRMHATLLAQKRREMDKEKKDEDVPVYDPDAPKKKTVKHSIEASEILKDLEKGLPNKVKKNYESSV